MLSLIFILGVVVGYVLATWEHNFQQWNAVYSWLQLAADVVRGPTQLAFQQPLPSQATAGAVPVSALLWLLLRKKATPALGL